ncbi:unnamed protein product, partial [Prunus brigantina]
SLGEGFNARSYKLEITIQTTSPTRSQILPPNYKLRSANSFSSSQELPLEDFVVTRKAWGRLQRKGCSSTCFSISIIVSEL